MTDINAQIAKIINDHDVVVFMKGTADFPMCGFSGQMVHIFTKLGIDFFDVNALETNEMRQGIKDFTNWPTIPQIYIKGEFIGGCDIVREMYQNGELQALLAEKGIAVAA